MTIDEAIAKYKEITNTDAICPGHCNISCDKCVQESKQIAEWLEELVMLRLDSCMIHMPERLRLVENGYNQGYNKAIDDFVANVKDELITDYSVFNAEDIRIFIDIIEDIAEQLKAGR